MVVVLTSSGLGTSAGDFNQQVKTALSKLTNSIYPIHWQLPSFSRKLGDLFDPRSSQEIYENVLNQILAYFAPNGEIKEKIVIISASAGSTVIENALSMLNIPSHTSMIVHVMLAPAIGGSDWAGIGQFASTAAALVLPLLFTKSDNKHQNVLLTFFAIAGGLKMANKDRLLSDLSREIEKTQFNNVIIPREIIFGTKDSLVNQPPKGIAHANYYEGDYTHSEVTNLMFDGLKQKYHHLETVTSIAKLAILTKTLQ